MALDVFFRDDVRDHLRAAAALGGDLRTLAAVAVGFGVTLDVCPGASARRPGARGQDRAHTIEGSAGDGDGLATLDVGRLLCARAESARLRGRRW